MLEFLGTEVIEGRKRQDECSEREGKRPQAQKRRGKIGHSFEMNPGKSPPGHEHKEGIRKRNRLARVPKYPFSVRRACRNFRESKMQKYCQRGAGNEKKRKRLPPLLVRDSYLYGDIKGLPDGER